MDILAEITKCLVSWCFFQVWLAHPQNGEESFSTLLGFLAGLIIK